MSRLRFTLRFFRLFIFNEDVWVYVYSSLLHSLMMNVVITGGPKHAGCSCSISFAWAGCVRLGGMVGKYGHRTGKYGHWTTTLGWADELFIESACIIVLSVSTIMVSIINKYIS